jgi:hypothetical protein
MRRIFMSTKHGNVISIAMRMSEKHNSREESTVYCMFLFSLAGVFSPYTWFDEMMRNEKLI